MLGAGESHDGLAGDVEVAVGEQPRSDAEHGPRDLLDALLGVGEDDVRPAPRVVPDDVGDRSGAVRRPRAVVGEHHLGVAPGDRRLDVLLPDHLGRPPVDALGQQVPVHRRGASERHEGAATQLPAVAPRQDRDVLGRLDRLQAAVLVLPARLGPSWSRRAQFSWLPLMQRSRSSTSAQTDSIAARYPSWCGPMPKRRSPSWQATSHVTAFAQRSQPADRPVAVALEVAEQPDDHAPIMAPREKFEKPRRGRREPGDRLRPWGMTTRQPNEITEVLDRPLSQEMLARDITPPGLRGARTTPAHVPIAFTWNGPRDRDVHDKERPEVALPAATTRRSP